MDLPDRRHCYYDILHGMFSPPESIFFLEIFKRRKWLFFSLLKIFRYSVNTLNTPLRRPWLRTYASFKGHFQCEPYTKITDKSLRRCFAKFRCSDHNLRIETGRRENLPVEDRKCLACKGNKIEDEMHFLTVCPKYNSLRTELYDKIEKI